MPYPGRFTPKKKPSTHSTKEWVGPMEVSGKEKNYIPHGISNPVSTIQTAAGHKTSPHFITDI
jgi:hypothetical protein